MKYTIGQVLFAVLNKKNQVYPMQVVEIITKKTLKGEEVQYLLQGGSNKTTTIMLDKVDGEIFDSADVARRTLISRATKQINRLVDTAVVKSKEWYGSSDVPEPQTIQGLPDFDPDHIMDEQEVGDVEQQEQTTVMLADGTVAKIKMPSI
jgi:hypothetical protein